MTPNEIARRNPLFRIRRDNAMVLDAMKDGRISRDATIASRLLATNIEIDAILASESL
jgi:hypothetical protein